MNKLTRCLVHKHLLLQRIAYQNIKVLPSHRFRSTETEILESTLEDDIRKIEPRIERRKPPIAPFMKDVFCGIVNTEILAFPEILNKQEIEDLKYKDENLNKYISDNNHSDKDIMEYLKRTSILGAPATTAHGGLSAILTERCKLLETLGKNTPVAMQVVNHWCGIDSLKAGLLDESINEIIPEVASGEYSISTILLEMESTLPNQMDIKCKAKSTLNKSWQIEGEKIINEDSIDNRYLITICQVTTDVLEPFLILPNSRGVTFNPPIISFRDTQAIVLGRKFGDFNKTSLTADLLRNSLNNKRLGVAAICLGLIKHTVSEIVAYTREKYVNGVQMSELPLLQDRLAHASKNAYILESMIYLTCGLNDGYLKPDSEIEMVLTRTYAITATFGIIHDLIECIGSHNLPESLRKCMEDAKSLYLWDEINDKLNIYAMLCGLQHAAPYFSQHVRKTSNILKYPWYTFSKTLKKMIENEDHIKEDFKVPDNLHPSLQEAGIHLEYCLSKFKYCNELLLGRHGLDVVAEHRFLQRLSLMATDIYSLIATLSRASRSYCIGLYVAEEEIFMAQYIANLTKENVKTLMRDIENDHYINNDSFRVGIGEKIFKHGKIQYEHCLERVFF